MFFFWFLISDFWFLIPETSWKKKMELFVVVEFLCNKLIGNKTTMICYEHMFIIVTWLWQFIQQQEWLIVFIILFRSSSEEVLLLLLLLLAAGIWNILSSVRFCFFTNYFVQLCSSVPVVRIHVVLGIYLLIW